MNVEVRMDGGDPDSSAGYWGWPAICANGNQLYIDSSTIYVENKGGRGIVGNGVSILNDSEVTSIVDTTVPAGHDYCAFLVSIGGLKVEDSTLTAKVVNGADTAIRVSVGDITFKNSTVTGSAAGAGYGINISQFAGKFTIDGGTVNGTGAIGIGHFGNGDFSIYGGAQVTATGTKNNSHGLYSHQSAVKMSVSGKDTKVKATSDAGLGVYSIGSIELSDGAYAEASGKNYNFYSYGNISVSDSTLDSSHASSYISVWAADTLSITGDSDVTAMGIGAANGFTVEPASGRSIIVKTGSSEEDAENIGGSLFGEKVTLPNYQSGTFFHSTAHVHNVTHVAAKTPNCTEDGNIEYWYCEDCGNYFSDENCQTEISADDIVGGKATGHRAVKYAAKTPTATETGNIEYWYCESCGQFFKDAALTQIITKEQTVLAATGKTESEEPGEKTETSAEQPANDKKDEKDTDKTESADSPKTGDSGDILLWTSLMLVAGTALSGMTVYSRKKRCDK